MSLPPVLVLPQTGTENVKGIFLKGGFIRYSSSNLQCALCKKCLSVRPVSETDDGQFTCGRCAPKSKQCQLYDALAQHIQFSCVFTGCTSKLNWGGVEKHERNCYFRDISCPLPDCVETYQLSNLESHFKQAHTLYKKLYRSGNLNSTNSAPHINLICISYEDVTFIVFIKIFKHSDSGEKGKYTCQFGLLDMKSYAKMFPDLYCEVKINISSNIALTKTVNWSWSMKYSETKHCLRCLYDLCNKPEHVNMDNTLLTDDLAFETENESFSYVIQIYEKYLNLKCTVCPKNFGEIIYICHICGKSFCSDHYQLWIVKPKQPKCPCCKAVLNNCARNFCLEKIITAYRQSL